jgi:chromosome segregation ATPase
VQKYIIIIAVSFIVGIITANYFSGREIRSLKGTVATITRNLSTIEQSQLKALAKISSLETELTDARKRADEMQRIFSDINQTVGELATGFLDLEGYIAASKRLIDQNAKILSDVQNGSRK